MQTFLQIGSLVECDYFEGVPSPFTGLSLDFLFSFSSFSSLEHQENNACSVDKGCCNYHMTSIVPNFHIFDVSKHHVCLQILHQHSVTAHRYCLSCMSAEDWVFLVVM